MEDTEQFKELLDKMEQSYNIAFPPRVISTIRTTTTYRKKEDVAAKTLQRAWRRHRVEKQMINVAKQAAKTGGVDPHKLGSDLNAVLERSTSIVSSNGSTPLASRRQSLDTQTKLDHSVSNGHVVQNGHANGKTSPANGKTSPANGKTSHINGDGYLTVMNGNGTTNGHVLNGKANNGLNGVNGSTVSSNGSLGSSHRPVTPVGETDVSEVPVTRNDLAVQQARKVLRSPTLGTLVPSVYHSDDDEDVMLS